jgi:hypothetical protein
MSQTDPDAIALRLLRAMAQLDQPAQFRALEPCDDPEAAAALVSSLAAIVLSDWMDTGRDPEAEIYRLERKRRAG